MALVIALTVLPPFMDEAGNRTSRAVALHNDKHLSHHKEEKSNMPFTVRKLDIVACALAGAVPFASHAQTPERELKEVRVQDGAAPYAASAVQVGTFRDTDPLDVPLTVNVVPRAVLDAQAATSIYDALKNTAGVTRSQLGEGTYDNISIRGILVENRSNYRLNGALPIVNLIDLPLENKERVEVLKGVSGLYYGLIPPSGVVNLVTKRAGSEPVSTINVRGNGYGAYGAHVDLARRYGEDGRYGLRINAASDELRNAIHGYRGHKGFVSGAFDWQVTRGWQLRFDAEYIEKDATEQAAIRLLPAVNGTVSLPAKPDPTKLLSGTWARYDAQALNVLARSDVVLSENWIWTVELGQATTRRDRSFSQLENYNLATGNGTLRFFLTRGQEYTNRNARSEFVGNLATGPLRHELSLGVSGNRRDQSLGATQQRTVAQNLYDPATIAQLAPVLPAATPSSRIEDKGAYLFDRISIGERWQVMAGLRRTDYSNVSPVTHYEANETMPAYAVLYKLRPRLNLYASYLEGLEEGGQAPQNAANALEVLPPLKSRQREIGAKADVARGVQLTAAYFDIDRPASGTNPVNNRFELTGVANYRGVELSATGAVAREWNIYASALFLDAEQTVSTTDPALLGKQPENTPRRAGSVFAEYRPAGMPQLALSAGAYYVGARAVNPLNQAYVEGYTRIDFGARYTTRLGHYRPTLQVYIENAFDARYWSAAGNNLLAVGQPRTIKFSASLPL